MRKITKKTIKNIKAGRYDDLLGAIGFLIDSYEEDKFDAGYRSCLEDMSVRSYRLAEYLIDKHPKKRVEASELSNAIEEYFIDALKENS